jgi:serine/threonine protein kinase
MSYLHGEGIVHGNLYPVSHLSARLQFKINFSVNSPTQGNILISNQGTARVTDIGLNTLVMQHMYSDVTPVTATWMYAAPEKLELGIRTTETDIYALASTIYTVSGNIYQLHKLS